MSELRIEDVSAVALADRFGTPLSVVSEAALRAAVARWQGALGAAWPHGPTRLLPSLKANPALALRRVLDDCGTGCDVFGPWELELALRAGTPPALISLNGSTKADAALERAVAVGARVTLDSLDELERTTAIATRLGTEARVALRLRPWLPATAADSDFAPGTPAHVAVQDYRAGMTDAEVEACLGRLREPGPARLVALMAHASRQTTDLAFWEAYAREVGRRAAGLALEAIDLGGGFAPRRDPTGRADADRTGAPEAPTPEAYCAALARGLEAGLGEPAGVGLELEPGRAIYAEAGVHLARVRHVKAQSEPLERRWIETDTSEAFLPDVNLERSRFACVVAGDTGRPDRDDTAVTGISCGFDLLAAPGAVPDARAGDVLAFLDTGAYQDAAASNFNAMPRPPIVLVTGADARVIRRRETMDDLLARETEA